MLLLKNLLFTVVVPGTVTIYAPMFIVRDQAAGSDNMRWVASVTHMTSMATPSLEVYIWASTTFALCDASTPAILAKSPGESRVTIESSV